MDVTQPAPGKKYDSHTHTPSSFPACLPPSLPPSLPTYLELELVSGLHEGVAIDGTVRKGPPIQTKEEGREAGREGGREGLAYLMPGLHEGVAINANIGESPSVEVLSSGVQAGYEAVHQTLERVVSVFSRLLDEGLWRKGGREGEREG